MLSNDISALKDIKLEDVRSSLQSKPMMGLKILLVIVAVGVLIFGWSAANKRKKAVMADLDTQNGKLQVFQDLQKVKGDYDQYMKALPQSIDSDALMKEVSEIAERNQIRVLSFLPSEAKINDLVTASDLDLTLSAPKYENVVAFLAALEKSPFLIRVDRWSGQVGEGRGPENQKTVDVRMVVQGLKITLGSPGR